MLRESTNHNPMQKASLAVGLESKSPSKPIEVCFEISGDMPIFRKVVTWTRKEKVMFKALCTNHQPSQRTPCKSKNDDLGIRTLQPNGEWEFSFHISWVAVTEFYYYFWYDNFQVTFDVFKDGGLYEQCGGEHCIWIAQEDGFYLYSIKLGYNVKMHDWSNK
ncbi:hypothetical protein CMV_007228 [Castanea mollissima]|uniref:S-protein homolog n=1 Tax=Castanea mollissima TaxID=60419 RepID=A0A8J4VSU1_9ROSI|nr:hypothetical protein CMV_007228 [Castanea mollissima]